MLTIPDVLNKELASLSINLLKYPPAVKVLFIIQEETYRYISDEATKYAASTSIYIIFILFDGKK